jgi:MraZ protein
VETNGLRGSASARIDDKGRLKLPNTFRAVIEREFGREVFVTSLTGVSVLIYPMPVWLEIERKVAAMPSTHPARRKYLDRVNYFGQATELDPQGRLIIQPRLRDGAQMKGDVDVIANTNYLEVWNSDRLRAKLHDEPWTDQDGHEIAGFGV